jgi:glycosyltransferase involved in cell wall biosynthesis
VDLVLDAMARVRSGVTLVIAGDGSARRELEIHARHLEIENRVTFLGRVDDNRLIELYSRCRGVVFVPYQEDYGYVTLEAFLSGKPVITTSDAGGPLEFVSHATNGLVCEPTPEALADAIDELGRDKARAAALGGEGAQAARTISWEAVVDRLTAAGLGH